MVSKNHSSPNGATDEADLPQNIIFNTKSQFMCSLTPQLTLLDVSPSFSQAYGLQQRQAAGAKFAEVIWPEHTVLVESSLQDLTPEYRIMTFEQGNTSAEHLPRWQLWTIIGNFDPLGRPTLYRVYSQDISKWKMSESNLLESELQYRAVVEDQYELLCRYKPDWPKCTILVANDAYCRAHGLKREDLVGNSFMDTLSKEDRARIHNFIETATVQSPMQSFTQHITRANGEAFWVEWQRRALFDSSGVLYAIQGVGRDVTKLRQAELKLVKKNAELERKNTALTEVLEHIEQKKEEIKDNVRANVHELFMPLLEKLRSSRRPEENVYIDMLERSLENLTSAFGHKITSRNLKLTPKEINICNLIKHDLPSKEIARLLGISLFTVERHRNNIRAKLGITNKHVNLGTYLKNF